ncbi:DUF6282 family protein [Pseudonocardia cypriaca]|uniref:Amidohydrolase family protein n=1 Tax=Pseudonocardia cypriaca TaxID=882449 RepID=A0A543FS04_9PSEU|nr:DUF6282 family protein [Pseudonocardia cypriaca]TQM36524.1 hypothetical protein FB388_3703 [Pseudonocardia cypriaca]
MTQTASGLWDETLDADRFVPDPEADGLLVGGVDLHTHPGPSPFPRRMSILDAATDAATVGFRAIVCKSHHHSMQTDILALEPAGLAETGVQVFGGIALNRTVGGLNPYAVELALRMGGRVVWFPTISSTAHLEFHRHHNHSGFPVSGIPLRDNEPISVVGDDGRLVPEAQDILSVIAGESAILNCGHLPADEIDVLVPAAVAAGVERIVVSHPDFIVGAAPERVGEWCRRGAAVEHCLAMVARPADGSPVEKIAGFLREAGVGHTLFSSDLGQKNNPLPVTAYRRMVRSLLDAGTATDDIRAMVGGNAAQLLFP